jgi:FtsP/CotA-like multicopper oxidase with cupredoxin domain
MDRRTFLGLMGAGATLSRPSSAAGALTGLGHRSPSDARAGAARTPLPRLDSVSAQDLTLTARAGAVTTPAGAFDAWTLNGSLPSPLLRLRQGDRTRITLVNELPEPTILHWHGLEVPEAADGHPRLAIGPGERYDYDFDVVDRPGLYWYHPHTHERTASQTYRGMAGLMVIAGEEEDRLDLPAGEFELPLILRDRRAGSGDPFTYAAGMGPDVMYGYLGDTAFANGVPEASIEVKRGVYRLRILNASNARILDLGLDTGDPLTLIGTDGGLLGSAAEVRRIMMGTGERADLLVDFSRFEPGTRVVLRSHAFQIPGMMGMMGGGGMGRPGMGPPPGRGPGMGRGMMGGMGGLPQGTEMDFVEFVVGNERGPESRPLPSRLSDPAGPTPDAESRRRSFRFESMMMQHTINGRSFAMDRADVDVPLGRTEVWSFVNESGFPHPVHVHVGRFRVMARAGGRGALMPWETGLKDTVLVLPGERVDVAVRFDRYPGLFLLHCHNLEHEDMGMMSNFRVLE